MLCNEWLVGNYHEFVDFTADESKLQLAVSFVLQKAAAFVKVTRLLYHFGWL